MNDPRHHHRPSRIPHHPDPQPTLHSPTLDAVLEMLFRTQVSSPTMNEVIRLVDAMRPPMAITTMGDLFGHVDAGEEDEEQAEPACDDACEICGVRCTSTGYAPYPGLCVRCTAKVQHLQTQKCPPQQKQQHRGGGVSR